MYYEKKNGEIIEINKRDLYLSSQFKYSVDFFNNEENKFFFHFNEKKHQEIVSKFLNHISDDEKFFVEHILDLKNKKNQRIIFHKNLDEILKIFVLCENKTMTIPMCHQLHKAQLSEKEKKFISYFINEESFEICEKKSQNKKFNQNVKKYLALESFVMLELASKINLDKKVIEKYLIKAKKNDIFLDVYHQCYGKNEEISFIEFEKVECIVLKNASASMIKQLKDVLKIEEIKNTIFESIYFIEEKGFSHKMMFQTKDLYHKENVAHLVNHIFSLVYQKNHIDEKLLIDMIQNDMIVNRLRLSEDKKNVKKMKI